jgi:Spy/CpxP family protein refolding chaperone
MNRITRSRLSLVVLLIVTFVSGGLAGAAGDRLLHADEAPRRGHGDRGKRNGMERLLETLDLTAGQQVQVQRILGRHRPQIEAIWESCKPRIAAQVDSTNAEIRALLSATQREDFDREVRALEEHRRNRHGRSEKQ